MTLELIYLHYLTPIIIAYLARLVWWVFFSPEDATFLPPKGPTDLEWEVVAVVLWPLTLFVIVCVVCMAVVLVPMYLLVAMIRGFRIARQKRRIMREKRLMGLAANE